MTTMGRKRTWIMVDVETSGPSPAHHALLSLGACAVDDPESRFYVEMRPEHARPGWGSPTEPPAGTPLSNLPCILTFGPPCARRGPRSRGHALVRGVGRRHGRWRPTGLRRPQRPVRLDVRRRGPAPASRAQPLRPRGAGHQGPVHGYDRRVVGGHLPAGPRQARGCALGAEIRGIDLAEAGPADAEAIRALLTELGRDAP